MVDEQLRQMAEGLLNAALANCEHPLQLLTYDLAERWLVRNQEIVVNSHSRGFVKPDAYRTHIMASNIALKAVRVLRDRYIETMLAMLERSPVREPQRGNG